jgi:peptidyl-prolyl cis-trans isomerase D
MLDFFRNHKRAMMVLLVLLIVPGLGFVGIEGFRGMFDNTANVATVNGQKITRVQFDDAMRDQLDRARQMMGASFDQQTFDTPAMREAMLDNMIRQRIIADETRKLHLTASDNAVRDAIMRIPLISQLRKPDGSFDLDQYRQVLAAQGMTPDQFDDRVRYQLSTEQITNSIQSSAFTPKALAVYLNGISGQSREVQALVLRPADYAGKVKPTDAQLQQYYDTHRKDFETPERATVQYVTMSAANLGNDFQPSDADLKKYYDDNVARFRTAEQIRASHILIAAPASSSAADKAKAKARAEEIDKQVKAHPDQFAALAKQDSQDPGSAEKGGDLGYFGPGMMVKPFEDAAQKLKKGEISDVVQSDFGYHVIQVTDIKPAATKPFAEVKDSLVGEVRAQHAAKAFTDDADSFTNLVYEQAASLQPAADKFKLPIQTATVARTADSTLAAGSPLNNPKFLAAVFADDSIKSKHNTAAIDVGGNTLIAAHVTNYQAATVQPFAKVQDTVRQKVQDQLTAELARRDGEAKLAALQKTPSTDGFGTVSKVSRKDTQGIPPPGVAAIFKADARKLPAYSGVDLGPLGYAIYRVNAVDAPQAPSAQQLQAAQAELAQVAGQADLNAYLVTLRGRSDVKTYGTPGASSSTQ